MGEELQNKNRLCQNALHLHFDTAYFSSLKPFQGNFNDTLLPVVFVPVTIP